MTTEASVSAPPGVPPVAQPPVGQDLRLVRAREAAVGFAECVAHLMTKPAFARAPFGHIARVLAGQVARGHYAFVKSGPAVVGFVGWARASEAIAEAWLAGARPLDDADARVGDCVLINCWQADAPAVTRFMLAELGGALAGCRRVYTKRHYPDGRVRSLRLDVARRSGAAGGSFTPTPMEAPTA